MNEGFSVVAVHPLSPVHEYTVSDALGSTCRVIPARDANQLAEALAKHRPDAIVLGSSELSWVLAELTRLELGLPLVLALDRAELAAASGSRLWAVCWAEPETWPSTLRALAVECSAGKRQELDGRVRRIERVRPWLSFPRTRHMS